jgi:hypothetical protein
MELLQAMAHHPQVIHNPQDMGLLHPVMGHQVMDMIMVLMVNPLPLVMVIILRLGDMVLRHLEVILRDMVLLLEVILRRVRMRVPRELFRQQLRSPRRLRLLIYR